MRKTTEELWSKALSISPGSESVTETFRRLVIENERECAEAVAYEDVDRFYANNDPELNNHIRETAKQLFTFPPAAIDRDSVIEALQLAHDHMRLYLPHYTEKHNVFDTVTRALKSQLAAPDLRDEVIRQQAEALREAKEALLHAHSQPYPFGKLAMYQEAIAAIDKVMKERK